MGNVPTQRGHHGPTLDKLMAPYSPITLFKGRNLMGLAEMEVSYIGGGLNTVCYERKRTVSYVYDGLN